MQKSPQAKQYSTESRSWAFVLTLFYSHVYNITNRIIIVLQYEERTRVSQNLLLPLLKEVREYKAGPVAQLNRAPDSGSDGRGFESLLGHAKRHRKYTM